MRRAATREWNIIARERGIFRCRAVFEVSCLDIIEIRPHLTQFDKVRLGKFQKCLSRNRYFGFVIFFLNLRFNSAILKEIFNYNY